MEELFTQCLNKQERLKEVFHSDLSQEEKYHKIIEFGQNLSSYPENLKQEENRVTGCQSTTYLYGECRDGTLYFNAFSDALITKGLATIMLYVYDQETPETILNCKPNFLNSLGILASLSPNRANGLKSFYKKMLEIAIKNFN